MSATRVVEPIDVLEYRRLGLTPSMPFLPPDQFRLQRFEERLDRRIVVTITLAAHRRTQAVGLQLLLIIVGTILAATIRVEKAPLRRLAQAHSHVQRPDCQILFYPVADCPAHHTAAMQVKDDGEVEPAF